MEKHLEDNLRDQLRQGSEAKHYGTRRTPDGDESVEMVPIDWAIEVAVSHTQKAVADREKTAFMAGHDAGYYDYFASNSPTPEEAFEAWKLKETEAQPQQAPR